MPQVTVAAEQLAEVDGGTSCGKIVFVVTLASSLAAGSRLLTELTGFD